MQADAMSNEIYERWTEVKGRARSGGVEELGSLDRRRRRHMLSRGVDDVDFTFAEARFRPCAAPMQ